VLKFIGYKSEKIKTPKHNGATTTSNNNNNKNQLSRIVKLSREKVEYSIDKNRRNLIPKKKKNRRNH